jgi:UDP-2-acetamido-2-deoxy-ribo-hexuluronate aminotransferase
VTIETLWAHLREAGVPTVVHYPLPLHQQPALAAEAGCPVSERLARRVLSLPMHASLERSVIASVATATSAALESLHA